MNMSHLLAASPLPSCFAAALAACGRNDPASLRRVGEIVHGEGGLQGGDHPAQECAGEGARQRARRASCSPSRCSTPAIAVGAETEARKALELKYSPDEAYPLLARALLRQGEFRKVVAELGGPSSSTTPAARGRSRHRRSASRYSALGDRRRRARRSTTALAAKPDDAARAVVAGTACRAGQRPAAAR